jgi:NAD(P)-dependent dehydrogenase (short-subunit alcohol dehydrogenase family)
VVVSGGFGALGSLVGSWAAAQGARSILLLGRNASRSGSAALHSLVRQSEALSLAMCNITATEDCSAVCNQTFRLHGPHHFMHAGKSHGPILLSKGSARCHMPVHKRVSNQHDTLCYIDMARTVFTGGVTADGLLQRQTAADMRWVMSPKLDGAANMACKEFALPVQSISLFSSIASLLGNAGQGNYSAANAALDALAIEQKSQVCASALLYWMMHFMPKGWQLILHATFQLKTSPWHYLYCILRCHTGRRC